MQNNPIKTPPETNSDISSDNPNDISSDSRIIIEIDLNKKGTIFILFEKIKCKKLEKIPWKINRKNKVLYIINN